MALYVEISSSINVWKVREWLMYSLRSLFQYILTLVQNVPILTVVNVISSQGKIISLEEVQYKTIKGKYRSVISQNEIR